MHKFFKKTMKKTLVFAILLFMTGSIAMAQGKTKVQHLTYKEFLSKVWDFEKNPNAFVYNGKTSAIVDFYADWCGPCRKVAPILEKLANEYEGKLTVYKINVDQEQDLAGVFQIRSIPVVLFIPLEGRPMMQVGAMDEAQFREVIDKYLVK